MLIAAELAVAVVLLSGAGLLTRSFGALVGEDPGYQTDNVTTAYLALPAARYQSNDEVVAFYRDLIPSLGAIPGVTAAGAVTNLPLATSLGDLNFRIEGRPVPEGAVSPRADWQAATPGYFEAMGIRAVRGRLIETSDGAESAGVVVVNQTLARLHWPDQDPLGQRFKLGGDAGPGWVTVVGVVPDVRHGGLDEASRPQMYLAHTQFRYWGSGGAVPWMTLVVASPLDMSELRPQIAARVTEMDPSLPVDGFRTMAEVRTSSVSLPRFLMALMLAFAGVALTLAAVGVYGLTSYSVGRRTREFGIRVALGAHPRQVTRMVVAQGTRVAVAGAAVGLLGALVAGRALSSLLYEVSPLDPMTLTAVPALLGVVAVLATLAPARRATRADPVESLRAE
jgi:predicted permease